MQDQRPRGTALTSFGRLMVVCLFALSGCGEGIHLGTPSLTWTSKSMETFPFEPALVAGNEVASAWKRDSMLISADFRFAPVSARKVLNASLAYVSGEHAEHWLLVRVAQTEAGEFEATPSGSGFNEYPRDRPEPIEYSTVEVPIGKAIALSTELTSDKDLALLGEPDWPATAELAHRDRSGYSGSPIWVVTYQNRATSTVLQITLDAMTGELIDSSLH